MPETRKAVAADFSDGLAAYTENVRLDAQPPLRWPHHLSLRIFRLPPSLIPCAEGCHHLKRLLWRFGLGHWWCVTSLPPSDRGSRVALYSVSRRLSSTGLLSLTLSHGQTSTRSPTLPFKPPKVLVQEGGNLLIPHPGFSLYKTLAVAKGMEARGYPLLVRALSLSLCTTAQQNTTQLCITLHSFILSSSLKPTGRSTS